MPEPTEPTVEQIELSIKHVCYELTTMVRQLKEFATARRRGGVEQHVVNAYFEAGLLHARNLFEFLTQKKPSGTRMHPSDFGSPWQGRLADPTVRGVVDHNLTHLLWERVHEPLDDWPDMSPHVDDLLGLFGEFVESTPHGELFAPCLAEARAVWTAPTLPRSGFADMSTTGNPVVTTGGTLIPPRA